MTRLLPVIALGTLLLGSQVYAQAWNDWWETYFGDLCGDFPDYCE